MITRTTFALEELEEAAVLHELRDDVDRLLRSAHGVQLDELGVPQLLHNLSLSQKVLGIHRSWFERFNSDRRSIIPKSFPNFTKLAMAQLAHEL